MSSPQTGSLEPFKKQERAAKAISQILRHDYADSGSAIKWISRKTGASSHAIKNWYEGSRTPSLENFILLTRASPNLLKWFLRQTDYADLADIMKAHEGAAKMKNSTSDFEVFSLNFETENSDNTLKKMQKLTLRQLWFYAKIKQGRKFKAHDIVRTFDVGRATAYRDIEELVKLNLICKIGKGDRAYYIAL